MQRTLQLDGLRCPRGSIGAQGLPDSRPLPGTAYLGPAQVPSFQPQDSAWPSAVRRCLRLKLGFSSVQTNIQAGTHTIVAAKDKVVDWLQTEQSEEIPGQAGNPSHIQITRPYTRLEHRFELRSQRERQFHCRARSAGVSLDDSAYAGIVNATPHNLRPPASLCLVALWHPMSPSPDQSGLTDHEPREERVDPPHDQRLWNHHCHVALHHAHHTLHSRRVAHRVRSRFAPHIRLCQKLALLIRLYHVCLPGGKGGGSENIGVLAQTQTAGQRPLLSDLR